MQEVATPRAASRPRARDVLGPDWTLGWLFAAPAVIVILVLVAYPFGQSILYSFQNVRIGGEATFIGLANYHSLLFGSQRAGFLNSLRVTGTYVGVALAVKFFLGMVSALILHADIRARNLFRVLLFL